MPTPGYWIECSRQKITLPPTHTIWDESDSEHEDIRGGNSSDAYLERECSDLYEDDEDSEATPRYVDGNHLIPLVSLVVVNFIEVFFYF